MCFTGGFDAVVRFPEAWECRGECRAGVAMVRPMACHGIPHVAMESYATPWYAVGMP